MFTGILMFIAAIVVIYLVYSKIVLSILDSWGATQEEIDTDYPGDELVHGKVHWKMTHGRTIDAPPEKIFPYLAQVGQDKAGYYSFDWAEQLFTFGIYNTYVVNPEWQDLRAGDFLQFHKNGNGMVVHKVEKDRRLIFINDSAKDWPTPKGKWILRLEKFFPREKGHYICFNWVWDLKPLPNGKTRAVFRTKWSAKGSPLAIFIFKLAFAFVSDVMDIEMLRRVAKIAEGDYRNNGNSYKLSDRERIDQELKESAAEIKVKAA